MIGCSDIRFNIKPVCLDVWCHEHVIGVARFALKAELAIRRRARALNLHFTNEIAEFKRCATAALDQSERSGVDVEIEIATENDTIDRMFASYRIDISERLARLLVANGIIALCVVPEPYAMQVHDERAHAGNFIGNMLEHPRLYPGYAMKDAAIAGLDRAQPLLYEECAAKAHLVVDISRDRAGPGIEVGRDILDVKAVAKRGDELLSAIDVARRLVIIGVGMHLWDRVIRPPHRGDLGEAADIERVLVSRDVPVDALGVPMAPDIPEEYGGCVRQRSLLFLAGLKHIHRDIVKYSIALDGISCTVIALIFTACILSAEIVDTGEKHDDSCPRFPLRRPRVG